MWVLTKATVIASLDFFRRTVPADAVYEAYTWFDAKVIEALESKMEGSKWAQNKKVATHLHLPPSLGGLGVRQLSGASAAAANLASWACADKVKRRDGYEPTGFSLQVKNYNSHVDQMDAIPTDYRDCMSALAQHRKPSKHLCSLIRKKQARLFEQSLNGQEKIRWACYQQPHALLYLTTMDWGTVLQEISPSAELTIASEQFKYLFRRVLLGLDNPHNLELMGGEVCGHTFGTGAICTVEIDARLEHCEYKCPGIRGAGKHSSMQRAMVNMTREIGFVATHSGGIPGTTGHGDCTVSGGQGWPTVVDVKNYGPPKSVAKVPIYLAKVEQENSAMYKEACNTMNLKFATFAMGTEGQFGYQCREVLGLLATQLVIKDMVDKSTAFFKLRVRMQTSVMRQIAVNGMVPMFRIRQAMFRRQQLRQDYQHAEAARAMLRQQQGQREVQNLI
jgi:hypothetical protein